jgi:NAD(P)-dependent dehydrogenase (short-subunit alcohol dehydrogenase family)
MPNDRESRVALVTGGLRGLGRAMSLGLARAGHPVVAVGHIESDVAEMQVEAEKLQLGRRFHPLVADLRDAGECDRVVAATRERFGKIDILVNNAGLTFTYIDPARFRRDSLQRFWQVGDEIIDNVITTNYIAADRLARRVAPAMVAAGWGRIVNVTTKLDTMNRIGTHPYGAAKAGLEMATEVWPRTRRAAASRSTSSIPAPAPTRRAWPTRCARRAPPGAFPAWSSRRRWWRRCCSSPRARPTGSTAGGSTPICGTRTCRRAKPPGSPAAPPASSSTRTGICRNSSSVVIPGCP